MKARAILVVVGAIMKRLFVILFLVSLAGIARGASSVPGLILLGKVEGSTYSRAAAVSDDGAAVAVNCRSATSSNSIVALWTASGGLAALENSQGGPFMGLATRISGDGSTVIGGTAGPLRAFKWTSAGGVEILPEPADAASEAWDVSRNGGSIVGSYNTSACLWDIHGGPALLGGTQKGTASIVSSDGQTILGYTGLWGQAKAFRWTEATGLEAMPRLATIASTDLAKYVFAKSQTSDARYFWSQETGEVLIEKMPDLANVAVNSMSDNGIVVGDARSSTTGHHLAWIWTVTDGMQPLDDYLTRNVGLDLGDVHIVEAHGITPDGRTVVGMAENTPEGFSQACVVTIPEPGTLSLLTVSTLTWVRRRRISHSGKPPAPAEPPAGPRGSRKTKCPISKSCSLC